MQLHILLTDKLPIPSDIKVISDWGSITIVCGNNPNDLVTGKHIAIEAPEEKLKAWFGLFSNGVWVGKGSPMLQSFDKLYLKGQQND